MNSRVRNSRGFTLIEVLVASAILAGAMGLVLQLFSAGIAQMDRVSVEARQISLEREVVTRLRDVNPAQVNSGGGEAAGWEYRWEARQIEPFRPAGVVWTALETPRRFALYEIDVTVTRDHGEEAGFALQRIGWRDG